MASPGSAPSERSRAFAFLCFVVAAATVLRSEPGERLDIFVKGFSGAILVLAVMALLLWGWVFVRVRRARRAMAGQMFPAPRGMSRNRVDAVLPHGPSEDVSQLLGTPPAEYEPSPSEEGCVPQEDIEWVLTAELDAPMDGETVCSAFDREWRRERHEPTVYGRDAATTRWTFANRRDAPYSALKVAWKLYENFANEPGPGRAQLEAYRAATEKVMGSLGGRIVALSASPEDAAARSRHLSECFAELDEIFAVILTAPTDAGFDGRAVWDLLEGLGIEWGDGDLFHWHDTFQVWTSTDPGYFLPEVAAAGKLHLADLRFGFSIPRTLDPDAITTATLTAARHVQHKLGGSLLDAHSAAFDEERGRAHVDSVVQALREEGFTPGSDTALRIF